MTLGFRNRLVLFLVVTLAAVQVLTGIAVYTFTRDALIAQGREQLTASAAALLRQLDALAERVADGVQVVSLDFALRESIALDDRETARSALRNHGERVGASRMLLIGLDGAIRVDTGVGGDLGDRFPFADLLDDAAVDGHGTRVVALGPAAFWLVVVPVLTPDPIAFIAAGVPLDDALVDRVRRLSYVPRSLTLLADDGAGAWTAVAGTEEASIATALPPPAVPLSSRPVLTVTEGRERLSLATPLATAEGSRRVVALLSYALDEALEAYRPILVALSLLLAAGLGAAVAGALLIARSVARPVEGLARTARRIATGDYTPPPPLPQRDEIGALSAALGSMATAIREREARIRHQAVHDAVTGLRNRTGLVETIGDALAAAPGGPAALLTVGLGRLGEIVKTVGHGPGDRLTADAGRRLAALAPPGAAVARVSDTALALWLPDGDAQAALALSRRAVAAFDEPYQDGDLTVDASAAVGVALHPQHGDDAGALLQHADVALHQAFREEGGIAVYDAATDPHRPDRLSLMGELRDGLERGELVLFYQPKLDLAAGRIAGAEALVRWFHPKRGFVPPDAFIGLAEETGNIHRLTRWALATGAAQAAAWAGQGLALRTAVNLSVRDLADAGLPQRIDALLADHGVAPDRLILEVTESAIMGEPDAAIAVLRTLADRGIDLAIDDFGVGQSSFTYLRRLPVRELKIDKTFVKPLTESADDRAIVTSIVELGQRLGYRVTAEGVEDVGALAFLAEVGCDHAQGYHIAKPLAPDAFARFLDEGAWPAKRLEAA